MHSDAFDNCVDCNGALPILVEGVQQLKIELDATRTQRFAAYCRILLAYNQKVNLTAIDEPRAVMRKHFLDSLTIVLALPTEHLAASLRVIDVGSGGGLPGVAIAIVFPHWHVTLLESVRKKARFLELATTELDLTNTSVICERAEIAGHGTEREAHDLAVARAVGPVGVLIEYCAPLVRTGGLLVFYKSGDITDELSEAQAALAELHCQLQQVVPIPSTLGLGEDRKLVVVQKVGPTSSRFPRRVGLARSQPLRTHSRSK
jgi:16S rRNA (guanine527-N7)-methyltransferase